MGVLVVGALALIGGLAAACFTKAFGIVFLGEPRSAEAAEAHEAGAAMRWPMIDPGRPCVPSAWRRRWWPLVLAAGAWRRCRPPEGRKKRGRCCAQASRR